MQNIFDNFRLKTEKEDYQAISASIDRGVAFRGTNLWILIFAIFVASLGLNVNSTAVIIGAMLISPLMGPIMGLGLGMAVNDLPLLKKALYNYFFAAGVSLTTSTIYFIISPVNNAHSELLARTAPNIYDVLIALFGGLAGILATSSKQKGNVIPGVAIATALMPPLCTAGYGLATMQLSFFIGAFYLFIINTVFIALATFITVRLLKFPLKHTLDPKEETKAKRIVGLIVLITLIPSIYFGYDIVQKDKYLKNVNRFIETEAVFPNDYLLKTVIDPDARSIVLIYGGEKITEQEIAMLKTKLAGYNLENTNLEIRQGFSYLSEDDEQISQLTKVLTEKDAKLHTIKVEKDSIESHKLFIAQIIKEAQALYPEITDISVAPIYIFEKKLTERKEQLVYIKFTKTPHKKAKEQIENWLKIKFNKNIRLVTDQ